MTKYSQQFNFAFGSHGNKYLTIIVDPKTFMTLWWGCRIINHHLQTVKKQQWTYVSQTAEESSFQKLSNEYFIGILYNHLIPEINHTSCILLYLMFDKKQICMIGLTLFCMNWTMMLIFMKSIMQKRWINCCSIWRKVNLFANWKQS